MGLNEAELQLCELLGQVLELLRWNQVLGYSNQYLLHEKLGVPHDERNRVMRAAAQAVAQDGRLQDWGKRLLAIQDELQTIQKKLLGDGAHGGNGNGNTNGNGHGAREAPGDA